MLELLKNIVVGDTIEIIAYDLHTHFSNQQVLETTMLLHKPSKHV